MSLRYDFDSEFLRYTAHGDVDFEEGVAVLRAGLAEASAATDGAPWPVLFDIRASTEKRRGDELRGIASILGGHLGVVADHCAVVVSSPLYYGVGRMFGHFTETYGVTMEIFDTIEDAEAWLREPFLRES